MAMKAIEIFADAIKEYYGNYELEDLCNQFNIEMDYLGVNPNHVKLANMLINQNDYNHRKLLEKIIPDLLQRCNQRILNSTWESNVFDEQMKPYLKKLQFYLAQEKKPVQIAEPENYHFDTKTDAINFFSNARTAVTLIDSQLGLATFGCLKKVQYPIRLLTSRESQAFVRGFNEILKKFRASGHDVEVRRHVMIHDRYLFFNGRCWLASSSLSMIEHKTLSIIECIDAKSAIARTIERKWREAEKYLV